jgi:hypothetical protein
MDPKADDDAVAAADEDELADADAVAMNTPR